MTEEEILKEMLTKCHEAGFKPTLNATRIAKSKKMFFGDKEWMRCPCDRDNKDRFCISDLCKADIEKDGICHCRCYQKA